jgi:hypothetical protein
LPTDPNFGGAKLLATYTPGQRSLQRMGSGLAIARWYPTNVLMDGGRVAVLGGLDENGSAVGIPEVVDIASGKARKLDNVDLLPLGFSYPRAVAVGGHQVVVLRRSDGQPHLLNTEGRGSLQPLPSTGTLPPGPMAALGKGRFLVTGTAGNRTGIRTTRVAAISANGVTVNAEPDMRVPRTFHELTTLPDGSVLATGGTDGQSSPQHHLEPERWVPGRGWTAMAPAQLTRGYHSTAALLRDGTVIKMGSTRPVQTQGEIFYPPYLFNAAGKPRARPVIESLSRTSLAGRADINIVMADDELVAKVSLVRVDGTTHQRAMGQAFVAAGFRQSGRRLTVDIPSSAIEAPPGPYWVFVLNKAGTPSVAHTVQID